MKAPLPILSPSQTWLLERLDETWRRKPEGVDGRTVDRLAELGLLEKKRERPPGRRVMTTFLRRTMQGRRALNLPIQ